jgi:parvulin-like peptidyl-prolyl isomerase
VWAIAAPLQPLRADTLNRVVLRINDQIATLFDFDRRRDDAVRDITHRVTDVHERQLELGQIDETVFRMMFQELLLTSRADQLGVEVPDAQVDQRIAELKESVGVKTDADFQQALQQAGLTVEQLRAQTRRELRIREVIQREIQAKVKVKEEDMRRYYRKNQDKYTVPEQVQLREVVLLDDPGTSDADRLRTAGEIRQAVATGKSLADAVAPYHAKGQASSVVELGWVSPKDLDPKLEEPAWKLPKNGVTEPITARGGLHLIQLVDRQPTHVRPFAEVQASIQGQEQERLFRDESAKLLVDLETKSLVVADPPPAAANFRRKMGTLDEAANGLAAPDGSAPAKIDKDVAATSEVNSDIKAAHPATVDTSDEKKGGLPSPQPVGAPTREPVTIPPPTNIPPATNPVPVPPPPTPPA